MTKVVGISFKDVGKIYWFSPNVYDLKVGDKVVVETIRGMELGIVTLGVREIDDKEFEHELKPVVRLANKYDVKSYLDNKERSLKALIACDRIIHKHNLEMKLLDCEFTLDKQKIIIYYNAEGRVDFRELLKDLSSEFRVRIELRQIGPREGAKILGGIGCCGREICCKSHLREFNLVTMKMAKDQGMSLNAAKVAGLCGKLMCCIGYENSLYEEIRSRIPLVGDIVDTPVSKGCKVINVDILAEVCTVSDSDEKVSVWKAEELVKVRGHKEEVTKDLLTDDITE